LGGKTLRGEDGREYFEKSKFQCAIKKTESSLISEGSCRKREGLGGKKFWEKETKKEILIYRSARRIGRLQMTALSPRRKVMEMGTCQLPRLRPEKRRGI